MDAKRLEDLNAAATSEGADAETKARWAIPCVLRFSCFLVWMARMVSVGIAGAGAEGMKKSCLSLILVFFAWLARTFATTPRRLGRR